MIGICTRVERHLAEAHELDRGIVQDGQVAVPVGIPVEIGWRQAEVGDDGIVAVHGNSSISGAHVCYSTGITAPAGERISLSVYCGEIDDLAAGICGTVGICGSGAVSAAGDIEVEWPVVGEVSLNDLATVHSDGSGGIGRIGDRVIVAGPVDEPVTGVGGGNDGNASIAILKC